MNKSSNILRVLIGIGVVAISTPIFVSVGGYSLRSAAELGDMNKVKSLIRFGIPVDIAEPETRTTALLEAAEDGKDYVIEYLCETGANVNSRDFYNGTTPLIAASNIGATKSVYVLLKAGADPNIKTKTHGDTALIFASAGGYEETVKLLLDYGAELGVVNAGGVNALQTAKQNDHPSIVRILRNYQTRSGNVSSH